MHLLRPYPNSPIPSPTYPTAANAFLPPARRSESLFTGEPHFVRTVEIHGPKRIFRGYGWEKRTWVKNAHQGIGELRRVENNQ